MSILLPYQKSYVSDTARFKIWLASRQVGKSFAATFEAALDTLENPRTTWVYLSRGERQSRELAEKLKLHLEAMKVVADELEDRFFLEDGQVVKQLERRLPNGSRHIFLPANPDTARGYTGNIVLDEFAIHKDAKEIWGACYPTITRNRKLKVRVMSTPKGKSGKFYELWSGKDEKRGGTSAWSRHSTSIVDAVEGGLGIDIDELRAGLADEELWQQEYMLEFLDESTSFLSYELISQCEHDDASQVCQMETLDEKSKKFLGVDIGRHKDLTVFWLLEQLGDTYWTRSVTVLKNAKFAVQEAALYSLLPHVTRCCIDATGMGEQLAERAVEKFGGRVEPVKFNQQSKNDMAVTLRRAFEDRLIRIPIDNAIMDDLHSVKRVPVGNNFRYDVDANEGDGHADRFWALALARHAADQPVSKYESRTQPRRNAERIL
jgi:phage FluMu gp28-like protein